MLIVFDDGASLRLAWGMGPPRGSTIRLPRGSAIEFWAVLSQCIIQMQYIQMQIGGLITKTIMAYQLGSLKFLDGCRQKLCSYMNAPFAFELVGHVM